MSRRRGRRWTRQIPLAGVVTVLGLIKGVVAGDESSSSGDNTDTSGGSESTTNGGTPQGVQWITPTGQEGLIPGGNILAQWRSDTPLDSPSFALCTLNSCGEATYPSIQHNDDGTSQAQLSLPDMPAMEGMYLKMSPGGNMADTTSPAFNVQVAAAMPASSENPYYTATADTTSTATKGHKTASVSLSAISIPTQPAQQPFIPTSLPAVAIASALQSLSFLTMPSNSASYAADTRAASTKPTVVAIAIPLSICALIALIALLFCARNKVFRAPRQSDPEKDWEAALKAKLASRPAQVAGVGIDVNGVSVRQREGDFASVPVLPYSAPRSVQDGRDESRKGYPMLETYARNHPRREYGSRELRSEGSGRSGRRCLTPVREDEYFTRLPPGSDRRGSRYPDRERYSSEAWVRGYRRDMDDRYHPRDALPRSWSRESDRHYMTARRSGSSTGSTCDCPYHGVSAVKRPVYDRAYSERSDESRGSIVNPHPSCLSPSTSRSRSYMDASKGRPLPRTASWDRGMPHRTGVLERGPSSNSSQASSMRWDMREKRSAGSGLGAAGISGGLGGELDGLYESLRVAIGSPVRR